MQRPPAGTAKTYHLELLVDALRGAVDRADHAEEEALAEDETGGLLDAVREGRAEQQRAVIRREIALEALDVLEPLVPNVHVGLVEDERVNVLREDLNNNTWILRLPGGEASHYFRLIKFI